MRIHAIAHSIHGQELFRDDQDRARFVTRFAHALGTTDVRSYTAGLVDNHGHFGLQTGEKTSVGTFMRLVESPYCYGFNRRWARIGAVVRGRYRRVVSRDAIHWMNVIRYAILNPLKAGIVGSLRELETYPWTAYPELLGKIDPPRLITMPDALALFGDNERSARKNLAAFLEGSLEEGAWWDVVNASIVEASRELVSPRMTADEQRLVLASLVEEICREFGVERRDLSRRWAPREILDARAALVRCAVTEHGIDRRILRSEFGFSQSRLSQLLRRGELLLLPRPTQHLIGGQ